MFVCVYMCTHLICTATACMWRLEANLRDLDLLPHVGPKIELRSSDSVAGTFPLSYLAVPVLNSSQLNVKYLITK